MLDTDKDDTYPPKHSRYWGTSDHYLMGNVTPGDMRAIIQSQEQGSPGGGLACIDLLNRMWDCRTKRRITSKQVLQHQFLTQSDPLPASDAIEKQLTAWIKGEFKPDEKSLLGMMFALKPGTDRLLMQEHSVGA